MNFSKKIAVLYLVLIVGLACSGVVYAMWSDTLKITGIASTGTFDDCFSWVVSNDNGVEQDIGTYGVVDPGDNGPDPSQGQDLGVACARYDKDVALTNAYITADPHIITVVLSNAYPSYYPTVFFGIVNSESTPGIIDSIIVDEDATTPELDDIAELTVSLGGIYVNQLIDPGQEIVGDLQIHVEQPAAQAHIYLISIEIRIIQWNLGGTPGFWKNWNRHNTYTDEEIEGWLLAIDQASVWLGPTTVEDMESMLEQNCGKDWRCKFLKQYLPTRLDAESGRLTDGPYDFSAYDPEEYLGLGGSGTLQDIIQAIEGMYNTTDDDILEVMKDICDALNNGVLLPSP